MLEPFPLDQAHVDALGQAEALMYHCNFCPYLELKELLANPTAQNKHRFRSLFTTYYGLTVGGLTDSFKDRYFEILFSRNVIIQGRPDFVGILTDLSRIKTKRGINAVPFSFVSKLVAIHQERSPIYDRHVRGFLDFKEVKAPSLELRIEWFVGTINRIATSYQAWAKDKRIQPIVERLKARDARLQRCDVVRLMDFLVWKVGNQKLLKG